jgi:hypothetical protein
LFLAIQKTPDVVRRSLGLRRNRKMVSAYRAKNKSVQANGEDTCTPTGT